MAAVAGAPPEGPPPEGGSVANINVGVLGHVDCGKTTLVAALSSVLSTAALDKSPQSQQRGITLDLGFSSFTVAAPEALARSLGAERVQFTLVDCPGHASLIRTVLGGAQIIDLMVLVIDATKGIQAQTAECLVVGEVVTSALVVALSKTDLLPADLRPKLLARAQRRVLQTLAATKFAGCPVVPVSAKSGAGDGAGAGPAPEGLGPLRNALLALVPRRPRSSTGPFLMAIDHCFQVKGQGTVVTGTVLGGSLRVGDPLEVAGASARKVKSLQVFKRPVESCRQGDRVGVCVAGLEAGGVERGLAAAPGALPRLQAAVAVVRRVRFFTGAVRSGAKMHVTVGHTTRMATLLFFGLPNPPPKAGDGPPAFDAREDFPYMEQLQGAAAEGWQGVLLRFEEPLVAPLGALVVGSKLDLEAQCGLCRLVFHGRLEQVVDEAVPVPVPAPAPAPAPAPRPPPARAAPTAAAATVLRRPQAPAPPAQQGQQQQQQQQGKQQGKQQGQQLPPGKRQPLAGPNRCAPAGGSPAIVQPCCAPGSPAGEGSGPDPGTRGPASRPSPSSEAAGPPGRQAPLPLAQLRVFRVKRREGRVERLLPGGAAGVCRGCFKRETDIGAFVGMQVVTQPGGVAGTIEGSFGTAGKFRVAFQQPLPPLTPGAPTLVHLDFRKYIYDASKKRMVQ